MGNLSHSMHVDFIEQALQGEPLVFWLLGVKSLGCGELDSVNGVQGLSALISAGVVQGGGCIV